MDNTTQKRKQNSSNQLSENKVFKQNFGHGYFQFLILLLIPFFNELFSYAIISLLSLKLTNSFQKMNA